MGPRSLFSICMDKMTDYIEDGSLENYSIPEKISDLLLDTLDFPSKSPKIMEKFFKNSKLTKMELTVEHLKEIPTEVFRLHDLEHLELEYLEKKEFKILEKVMKKTGREIDILTILEKILSSESRKKMRCLFLSSCHVCSSRRLMGKIGRLLPNLTSLDLKYTEISKSEFKSLCISFPNLTYLSIADTARDSLEGISNLKNLEILNMECSRIATSDAIREIFQLKKLRVLDVSAEDINEMNCISLYLECDESLPELRFLDISFNNITEEQLIKLVESHPKLEKIGLVGTPLKRRKQMPNKTPELLTIRTLESCIKSFQHHTDRRDSHKTLAVLDEMEHILDHRYEEQTDETLKKCLMAILPTDSTTNFDLTEEKIANCLYWLTIDARCEMFDYHEIQLLIDTLLNKCSSHWTQEDDTDPIYIIQKIVWRIMNDNYILRNEIDNFDGICENAARIIEKSHVIEDEEAPVRHCMEILEHYNKDMTSEAFYWLSHREGFLDQILHLMETRDFAGRPESYFSFLIVSRDLACRRHVSCLPQARRTVTVWLGNLEKFAGNEMMVVNTLHTSAVFMSRIASSGVEFLFEEPHFSMLTNLLISHGTASQKMSIDFLVSARFYIGLKRYTRDPSHAMLDKLMKLHLSATDDVIEDLKNYIPNPGDTDRLAVYKWLVANGSRRSKGVAQWILGHFPEAEEPRAKRRRI